MDGTISAAKRAGRKLPLLLFAVFCFLWAIRDGAKAAPLENVPTILTQPDGSVFSCFSSGDERFNYLHDDAGSLIVQDEGGWYVYAQDQNGRPIPSEDRVNGIVLFRRVSRAGSAPARMKVSQVDLTACPELSGEFPQEIKPFVSQKAEEDQPALYRLRRDRDSLCNLVVFLRFQGEQEFVSGPADDPSAGGLTLGKIYKGVREYFEKISDGAFETDTVFLTGDGAGGTALSYEDSHPRAYYEPYSSANPLGYSTTDQGLERTQREMELLENALKAVLPSLPQGTDLDGNGDGLIDNITFVASGAAGGWNQILWPHNWALQRNEITAVDASGQEKTAYSYNFVFASPASTGPGVLSHELLHTVGFPDLYRYHDPAGGEPVGAWDIMGSINYQDPQFPLSYSANLYGGWGRLSYADKSGTYALKPLGTDDGSPDGYIIPTGDPNEYIVAEYRKNGEPGNASQDNIPRDGLLLYRVNRVTSAGDQNGTAAGGDEVYVFRPGDRSPNAGTAGGLSSAALGNRWGAVSFGSADGSVPAQQTLYFSCGDNTRIVVSEVEENSDGSLSFRVDLPEDENLVPPGSYDLSHRNYTVAEPGEYRFTGVTDCHSVTVAAGARDVTLVFDCVEADLSGAKYGSPVYLRRGASARLELAGENRLVGGQYEAAVHISETAELTVCGGGSLEAAGGAGAAALGGNAFEPAGALTVSGAAVTARGGDAYLLVGTAASLKGGAAPALGAGAGQRCGDICLESGELFLSCGSAREEGREETPARAKSGTALSTGQGGGSITGESSSLWADGALFAGKGIHLSDCQITIEREDSELFGSLEAEGPITLDRCGTILRGGGGSAVGRIEKLFPLTVRGGSLFAASRGYTLCVSSVAADREARLVLCSGQMETLFSGYSSGGGAPLAVQPGIPAGKDSRAALIQGELEETVKADWPLRLYHNGVQEDGFTLPSGCRTFAVTVAGAGECQFRGSGEKLSETVEAPEEGLLRKKPLVFFREDRSLPVLDLSSGPAEITTSGEYALQGSGSAVKIADGLDVTLYLKGAQLSAPDGEAAISAGQGGSLTLWAEESGGVNRLTGGRGRAAVETRGALSFSGAGKLWAAGGQGAPAVQAETAAAERQCGLFLASTQETAVSVGSGSSWTPRYGEAPILLSGCFQKASGSSRKLTFRGIGVMEDWDFPADLRSFCKTLTGRGEVVITTDLVEKSPALGCWKDQNSYENITLTRWDNASKQIDLSQGGVVITENGDYLITGSTNSGCITVADGVTAYLRLSQAQISISQQEYLEGRRGLVQLGKNCDVTLNVPACQESGLMNRVFGSTCALAYVPAGSRLTVDCQGTLDTVPGSAGPAFGTPSGEGAGEIVFAGGTVRCLFQKKGTSDILAGGGNALVRFTGGSLEVSGECAGAVGGPGSRIEMTAGSLSLSGGVPGGTLGGENSLIEISGGNVSLEIGAGDIGVGGRDATVTVSGGSVFVGDIQDIEGGMQAGVGGPKTLLSFTGGSVLVDSSHSSQAGWGALGGVGCRLSVTDSAQAAVRLKQRKNTPLAADDMLDPSMSGGFLNVRLAKAFSVETKLSFLLVNGDGVQQKDPLRTLSLPRQYYGFFIYLPAGVCEISSPGGSGGSVGIESRRVSSIESLSFNRLSGVWLGTGSVQYDGKPHSLELSGALPGGTRVSYTGNGQTLPGEYPVTAVIEFGSVSYTLSSTLTVKKAPLTVTSAAAQDKARYDRSCRTTGSIALSGAAAGDSPTATAEFRFLTPDVGEDKPVAVTNVALEQSWEDRYTLVIPEGVLDHVTASVIAKSWCKVVLDQEALFQTAGETLPVEAAAAYPVQEVRVTYNGSERLPQAPGSYYVQAEINDPNCQGIASGTLVLAQPVDLSAGEADISQAGGYTLTGGPGPVVVQADQLDGDVTLCLKDVSICLDEPGAVPIQVVGESPYTLTLLLPDGSSSLLKAGPGVPAVSCPGMNAVVSGTGTLRAYGGAGGEAVELSGDITVSGEPDCQLYSTLPAQAAPSAGGNWVFLSFESPAPQEMKLEVSATQWAPSAILLKEGYQSVSFTRDPKANVVLRGLSGERLAYLSTLSSSALNVPLSGPPPVEREIDISTVNSLSISQDGVYRLTGSSDKFHMFTQQNVEATVILDGVDIQYPKEYSQYFIACLPNSQVTLKCESDSRLDLGGGSLCRQFGGGEGTVRLEGPGTLRAVCDERWAFQSASSSARMKVEVAGPLELTVIGAGTAFYETDVFLLPDGDLLIDGSGDGALGFGKGSSLTASGGRAHLRLAGAESTGFAGNSLSLAGDAAVTIAAEGRGSKAIECTAAAFSWEESASLTAWTTGEDAQCLAGDGNITVENGGSLLCALSEEPLTAVNGQREIVITSGDFPGWTGYAALPQSEGQTYRSFLTLLPGAGDYELSCRTDHVDGGVDLTAQLTGVEPGAATKSFLFQALPQLMGLSLESKSFVYDGEEKALSVEGAPAGAQISFENNSHTLPGTYEVTAVVRRQGLRSTVLTGTIAIEKRPLAVAAVAEDKQVYDGSVSTKGAIFLENALPGDDPQAVGDFAFDAADVGTGKTVNVTNIRFEDESWSQYYRLEPDSLTVTAGILEKASFDLEFLKDSLSKEYGEPLDVSTNAPQDMAVKLLYDGEEQVPTLPGDWPVTAEIVDKNWQGTAQGTVHISKKKLSIQGLRAPEIEEGAEELEVTLTDSDAFDAAASGILEGDQVLVSGKGVYPDSRPGERFVGFTDLALSGAQADRYELVDRSAQGTGYVIPAPVPAPSGGGGVDPGDDPNDDPGGDQPQFADIQDHWAEEDILAMAGLGLMTGTGKNTFSPQATMSRAMAATVLYRLDDARSETGESPFLDVPGDAWYAPGVLWAARRGVVLGMGAGVFRPELTISREQMAALLYRFSRYRGEDVPLGGELDFPDGETVSSWARDALRWAVNQGIVKGRSSGMLDPKGKITRAEAAAMLCRYLELGGENSPDPVFPLD